MTATSPMSSRRRTSNYLDQNGSKRLTARQRRRLEHKQAKILHRILFSEST